MKTRVLTLLFCLVSIFSYSQAYFSNHAQWYIEDIGWEKCYEIYRHEYFIGDSIIDGKIYQILNGKVPLMSVKNKIYANISGKDLLLYDFDLQIGDSLPVYDSGEVLWHFNSSEPWINEVRVHYYAHVKSIDTLVLANGVKARVLYYAGREPDIEYVGNARGILAPLFYAEIPTCAGVVSMCFSDENGIIYENNGLCERLDDKFGKAFSQGSKWETIGDWGILTDAESGFGFSSCVVESAGDTVINDKQYQMFSTSTTRADGGIEDSVLLFVRSEYERWYGWSSDCPAKEYLLADFSMQVGDSLVIPYYFSDKPTNIRFHVTGVDIVTLNDGRKAKRLSFDGGKPAIIEHVGSEGGLYTLFGTLSAPSRIITSCYSVNDEIIYSDVIDEPLFLQYYDTLHNYYCSEFRGEYHPVFTKGKSWNYLIRYSDTGPYITYRTVIQKYDSDTIIGGMRYVYNKSDNFWSHWYIREDSLNQKVYLRPDADYEDKDYLLYDFSAQKGDTLSLFFYKDDYYGFLPNEDLSVNYVVKDIEIIDGKKHISLELQQPIISGSDTIYYSEYERYETWIEGIGNKDCQHGWHLLNRGPIPSGNPSLMCVHEGDNLIYATDDGIKYDCYVDKLEPINSLEPIEQVSDSDAPIYNILGQQVGKDYRGIVIQNGKKYLLQ